VQVGDLVQTVEGWSYKTWTGIILRLDRNGESGMVRAALVCWTQASVTQGNIFWAPREKIEVIHESR
jgi:hypothetical protein